MTNDNDALSLDALATASGGDHPPGTYQLPGFPGMPYFNNNYKVEGFYTSDKISEGFLKVQKIYRENKKKLQKIPSSSPGSER